MKLNHYIADVIGAAEANPSARTAIFRQAAVTLGEGARDPRNSRLAAALQRTADEFAAASERPDSISDFRDQLQESAQAYHEVGDPADDMAEFARLPEIHEDRTPGLPRVSIAPKSVTHATRLGDQATLKWEPTASDLAAGIRQQNTIAFWQGFKEEAQAVTVDVAILALPTAANGQGGPRPYGLVSYGSDGAIANVKFDVGFGTRFTVVGSYVSVLVGLNPPRDDFKQGQVTIGASLGFFAAPSRAPVMYTEYLGLTNVPPGNVSGLIPRPAHAMMLLPMQSNLIGGTATIEFLALDGILPQYQINWVNSAQNIAIPITDDIAWLRVTNTGADSQQFRLPFQLAL